MKEKDKDNSPKPLLIFFCGAIATLLIAVLSFCAAYIIDYLHIPSQEEKIYTAPKKIADYLYEITYSDYEKTNDPNIHESTEAFGCSSVRNGNFYGRNYDYIFNDTPEFVVKVEKTESRHASLGIATHYGLRETLMETNAYDEQLKLIPNFTLDGINDAGVIASINVVPGATDVPELTGTNPSGEPLDSAYVVRYILDNANSADHAIELLNSRNISGSAVNGLYLHIMIADPEKTYVVEYLDDKLVAEEKTGDAQIMTNFYVNLPELTDHASGVERYAILKENYAEGNSLVGMRNLMARVRYSNAYRYSVSPAWFSESIPQSLIADPTSEAFTAYLESLENMRKDYWLAISNDERSPANSAFWHTTHNSVYDIENRMLRVTVQEDYSHYYDFSL